MRIKVKANDLLFFSAYFLCLICSFYDTTTFKAIVDISVFHNLIRVYMLIAIGVKCIYFEHYSCKSLILIVCIVCVSIIATVQSSRATIYEYIILLVGSRNIDARKIIKVYFNVVLVLLFLAFGCSQLGFIPDYTIVRSGSTSLRHSFGIVYTTDFAAHVFYLLLSYFYLKKRTINMFNIIVVVILVYFMDRFCNARLSELMILLTLVCFVLLEKREKFFESRIFFFLVRVSGFCFAFFSIAITCMYDVANIAMIYIDETFFNGRLYVGKRVIDMYGFSLFGQNIKMQGDGYKSYVYDTKLGTTYLDSAYLQIAMLYGLVFLVLVLIAIYFFTSQLQEERNTKMNLIVFLILFSCIHNQYLISVAYNPFMIVMGGYFLTNVKISRTSRKTRFYTETRRYIARGISNEQG